MHVVDVITERFSARWSLVTTRATAIGLQAAIGQWATPCVAVLCNDDNFVDTVQETARGIRKPAAGLATSSFDDDPASTGASAPHTTSIGGGLAPTAWRRIRDHIEMTLASQVDVAELAALAELSPGHFIRAFRQTVGMPPQRYRLERRLDRASELIRQTDLSIGAVSSLVGFSDASHFSRRFAEQVGESPRAYRRRHR